MKYLNYFIILIIFSGSMFFVLNCTGVRYYNKSKYETCNQMMSYFDLMAKSKNVDTSVLKMIERCDKEMSYKKVTDKKLFCKKLIFGKDPIDKESDLYVKYIMCTGKKFYLKPD